MQVFLHEVCHLKARKVKTEEGGKRDSEALSGTSLHSLPTRLFLFLSPDPHLFPQGLSNWIKSHLISPTYTRDKHKLSLVLSKDTVPGVLQEMTDSLLKIFTKSSSTVRALVIFSGVKHSYMGIDYEKQSSLLPLTLLIWHFRIVKIMIKYKNINQLLPIFCHLH